MKPNNQNRWPGGLFRNVAGNRGVYFKFTLFAAIVGLLLQGCGGGAGTSSGIAGTPRSASVTSTGGATPFAAATTLSMNGDGRFIGYSTMLSTAPSGMPADVTQQQNVFVFDRQTGTSTLISVNPAGTAAGNGASSGPVISADGRYALFASRSTNLVAQSYSYPTNAGGNALNQIYLRDLQSGITKLISVDPAGTAPANAEEGLEMVFSRDGHFAAFTSSATNLVAGVSYAAGLNVFVRNLTSNVTELVSVSANGAASGVNGTPGPATNDSRYIGISDDGRYVSFESLAWNLVDGVTYTPSLDTVSNIFLRDRLAGTTALLSISADGTQASNGRCVTLAIGYNRTHYLSGDGSVIAFASRASNLAPAGLSGAAGQTNIYVRERSAAGPVLVTRAADGLTASNGESLSAAISHDARYITFVSTATNLVPDAITYNSDSGLFYSNVYRWNRSSGVMALVSRSSDGSSGADFDTHYPEPSDDGEVIAFSGNATNLTTSPAVPAGDYLGQFSVYRWTSADNKVQLASQSGGASIGDINPWFVPSADGSEIAFLRMDNSQAYYIAF